MTCRRIRNRAASKFDALRNFLAGSRGFATQKSEIGFHGKIADAEFRAMMQANEARLCTVTTSREKFDAN